jgi:beta-lactam-binding protein with PASTA domain
MTMQHSRGALAPEEGVADEKLPQRPRAGIRLDGIKTGWPRSGGLMLGGSGLVVLLLAMLVWWNFSDQPQMAVPNLIGMSRAAAEAQLKQSGLTLRAASEQISDQPAGTVLRTDPGAGTVLDQGGGVNLVVAISGPPPTPVAATEPSSAAVPPPVVAFAPAVASAPRAAPPSAVAAPAPVVVVPPPVVVVPPPVVVRPVPVLQMVPNVVGLNRPTAERVLEGNGLRVGWVTVVASDRPAWTVLRTDPRPGSSVRTGSMVDLVLAEPRQVLVSNVVGLDREKAEQVLTDQGLRVGTVKEEPSYQRPNTVLRTNPTAGTAVFPGRAVDLVVAKAAVPLKPVPNVSGLDRTTAEKALIADGFRIGSVTEEKSTQGPGTVLRTDPPAGTKVQPGTAVDLVVAKA